MLNLKTAVQKQKLQNSKDWKIIATIYGSTVWWIDGCVWKLYLSHDCMKWHNVMRKTANEANGGSLWLCRCTVCPIKLSWTDQKQQQLYSLTLRFNPDNAFILFWISFYFLIWLCSPRSNPCNWVGIKKKKNKYIYIFNSDGQNFDNVIKFINGIDLFCTDLLIFLMQSSDLLQDAKREKNIF